MISEIAFRQEEGWREVARHGAQSLKSVHSVVVTGPYQRAAACVAMGIADRISAERVVTLVNLWNFFEVDRLAAADDTTPGISDCFAFGISFSSATRPSIENPDLHVLSGGPEPYDLGEVFTSRRWTAFAQGIASRNGLLILIAPASAPSFSELAGQVEGAIVVGARTLPEAPGTRIFAIVSARDAQVAGDLECDKPTQEDEVDGILDRAPTPVNRLRQRLTFVGAFIAVVGIAWIANQYLGLGEPISLSPSFGEATPEPQPPRPAIPTTIAPEETAWAVTNPVDSTRAARFSVEILSANTLSGAIFTVRKYGLANLAGTVSPTPVGSDNSLWFKVIVGAYLNRRQADSLLVSLRKRRVVQDSAGEVVDTPFAFVIDSLAPDSTMNARTKLMIDDYLTRDFGVYALIQPNGSTRLYTGAFASPKATVRFRERLKAAGLNAVLENRTGRIP